MKTLSVLLVDDEIEFVSTLAERLELRGIRARTASDGQTALGQLVREEMPHVAVLDVMMPENGWYRSLKRNQENGAPGGSYPV